MEYGQAKATLYNARIGGDCLMASHQRLITMFLRLFALTTAALVLAGCASDRSDDTSAANQRKAVLAGLSRKSPTGKVASFKINILNISGDWAFADVTPLDKAGHPLAEQKVAVLHHVHGRGGSDHGWKEIDLSKVPLEYLAS